MEADLNTGTYNLTRKNPPRSAKRQKEKSTREKQEEGLGKKKMSDKLKEMNKELERSLDEALKNNIIAKEEKARLEKNIHYFMWIASVLVLVSLCIGLHWAFKGHETNHHELRLMLVGKTGAGKSASGNTILGEEVFRVEASPASVTASCIKKNKVLNGRNITIIDTPGVMDTWLISNQMADHAHECISMSSPDPHVFLLVIRLGRFTVEESNAVKWIQENFGEEALKFTIILFTGGDLLEGKPVEKFISNSIDLQNLVDTCEGRYHVFNNYEQSNRTQVTELFKKINAMLHRNMGYFYMNEVHQKVQQSTREEEEAKRVILEKEIQTVEVKNRAIMEELIRDQELKRKQLKENMIVEERRKINEMEVKLREEEEAKRVILEEEIKTMKVKNSAMMEERIRDQELKIKQLKENMIAEERRKMNEMAVKLREEEEAKRVILEKEIKTVKVKNKAITEELIRDQELKRKQLKDELKVEERRKMNEMAVKLRDEQYENKLLKSDLKHAYIISLFFGVLTVLLILILIVLWFKRLK